MTVSIGNFGTPNLCYEYHFLIFSFFFWCVVREHGVARLKTISGSLCSTRCSVS
jgi:hypothetical protein